MMVLHAGDNPSVADSGCLDFFLQILRSSKEYEKDIRVEYEQGGCDGKDWTSRKER